jgi:hypothetical protein
MDLINFRGHYPFSALWVQHNEHRIPFQRLLELACLYWFQGNHAFLFFLSWLVQSAQCAAIAFVLHRTGALTRLEWLTATGLILFCVFNPAQMQIFLWGFGPSVLGSFLFAVICLGSLTIYALALQNGRPAAGWLALSLISALISEYNLASGVLVWLMLPFCGFLLGLRLRAVISLVVAAALGMGIYLKGYQTPSNASDPLSAAKNFPQVLAFVDAYFAESWRYIWCPAGRVFAGVALVSVIATLLTTLWLRMRKRVVGAGPWAFLISIAGLMILTSLVTALGRQVSGVAQAREGRYQTPAMLFWCAIGILLILSTRFLGRYRGAALLSLQVTFSMMMLQEITSLPVLARHWEFDGYLKNIAGLSVEMEVDDQKTIRLIHPAPSTVIPAYRALMTDHLIRPPFAEYRLVGRPISDLFTISAATCPGTIEKLEVISVRPNQRDIAAEGLYSAGSPAGSTGRVFATADQGQIIGFGLVDQGFWHLVGTVPSSARKVSVYALLQDARSACLFPDVKNIPDPETSGGPVP